MGTHPHRIASILAGVTMIAGSSTTLGQSVDDYVYDHAENDGVGYQELQPGVGYRIVAPIHEAAKRGDIETIKGELAEGVPLDLQVQTAHGGSRWWQDTTPLMWAAMLANSDTVAFLVEHGADVNAKSSTGLTPLMAAAGATPTNDVDELERMMILVRAGADLEARNTQHLTALAFACGAGSSIAEPQEDRVPAHLIDDQPGAYDFLRPNVGGNFGLGDRPHYPRIVSRGDVERVQALIEVGANVNARTPNGYSLLSTAIHSTDNERFAALLGAGADPLAFPADGWSTLLTAAAGGTGQMVEWLIEAGSDANFVDPKWCDQTVLHWACGSPEDTARKVLALIEAGADPNPPKVIPLLAAIQTGDGEAIRLLLDVGADTGVKPGNGNSLFLYAAEYADATGLQAIMNVTEWRIDEQSHEHDSATALQLAATSTRDAGAKADLLLQHGADVHARTDAGMTAMIGAARRGNMNAIAVLARAGADVHEADVKVQHGGFWSGRYLPGQPGMTPLHYAANRGSEDTMLSEQTGEVAIQALLERGVELDARALELAMRSRNPQAVRVLLEAWEAKQGADHEAPLQGNRGPYTGRHARLLMRAIGLNDRDLVEALLDTGADVHSTRVAEETALMVAVQNSSFDIIRLLVERGADVQAIDELGATTLMHFAMFTTRRFNGGQDENIAIFRYLIEHGADIHARDNNGATCLIWCARESGAHLARLLVSAGADISTHDEKGRTALDVARSTFTGKYRAPILKYLESVDPSSSDEE